MGRTLLALTAVVALVLLYYAAWAAVTLIGLRHDVPNRWTLVDFALIGLPLSILSVAVTAVFGLARGRLLPLWICFGLLATDAAALVATFN